MVDRVAEQVLIEQLRAGKSLSFYAIGGSMEPFLPPGSRIWVAPCTRQEVHIGQIVVSTRPDGGLVVHRVIGRSSDGGLRTWGDGMSSPDAWISYEILGRVVRTEPTSPRSLGRRLRSAWRLAWHVAQGQCL